LLARIVKSKLALRGMTVRDAAKEIGERYTSVYDVVHDKWGKEKGKVAPRILKKLSEFLNIDIEQIPKHERPSTLMLNWKSLEI